MTQTATATDSSRPTRALYIAFDMGRDSWQAASSDGGKTRREVKLVRTDIDRGKADVLAEIAKARAVFGLPDDAPVHALYEAGRDGFWFARWLLAQGVQCLIVDPCSILVDRKAKQRKNDAIDSRALLDLLVRHVTGDRTVNTVAVPPPDAEDARELGRLLHRLGRARRSLALRLQSVLWSRGIDASYWTGIQADFDKMRTGDGHPLDRIVRIELEVLCGQIEHRQARRARTHGAAKRRARQDRVSTGKRANQLARSPIASGDAAPCIRGPAPLHVAGARSAMARRWAPSSGWRRPRGAPVR